MAETDSQIVSFLYQIPPLDTATERELYNAFRTWQPSWQTQRLASETSRTVVAERINFQKVKCRTFDTSDEEGKISCPRRLGALIVSFLVENYTGGSMPDGLTAAQARDFGNLLDVKIHVSKLLDLENAVYWRRVVWCMSNDTLSFLMYDRDPNTNWKRLGIELKIARLIEQEPPAYFHLSDLEATVKLSAPFVEGLVIRQLQPVKSVEPFEDYEPYAFYNYPTSLCHHVPLTMLGHLVHLTTLTLMFGVKNYGLGIHRRYYELSQQDVDYLGMSLAKLTNLASFTLSQTRLGPAKLAPLLQSAEALPALGSLNFSYCQLGKDCGKKLGRFLSRLPPSVRHLNLSGNRLDWAEVEALALGLTVYRGTLEELNLSHNPIGELGVLALGGAIKDTVHLGAVSFSGCQMGPEGAFRIIQLMAFHQPLRRVAMDYIPIGGEGQEKLLDVLRENRYIEEVSCRHCGLTERFLGQLDRRLERNKTFRETLRRRREQPEVVAPPAEADVLKMFQIGRQCFSPAK